VSAKPLPAPLAEALTGAELDGPVAGLPAPPPPHAAAAATATMDAAATKVKPASLVRPLRIEADLTFEAPGRLSLLLSSRAVPRVLQVSATSPEPAVIAEAAAVLARGALVAFPTETVYGLGARGLHERDVGLVFAAKQRPTGHPLILHVDGEAMAETLAASWPERASRLARAFWPGPLTLVVERAAHVPDAVTGGLGTVALRAPRHAVALALIRAAGEPLAAPSANAHTHVSPTTAAHVVRSLGDRVDLVLDGGACVHGIESTVVDVTSDPPRVLRAGAASLEAIRAVVPEVVYDAITLTGDAARASPGLASKHYAPRTRVVLAASGASFVEELRALVASGASGASGTGGRRIGAIVWSDEAKRHIGVAFSGGSAALVTLASLPADAEGYGHAIFAALHEADAAGLDALVIERVPDAPAWWAVADRIRRAAEE
jgi:L-threonylcarbamoyladenylate synthase